MALAEDQIIERYFAGASAPDVVVGVGDDGAVTRVPDGCAVLSAIAAFSPPPGQHGREAGARLARDAGAAAIGRLVRGGGTPRWLTLALTLPDVDEAWLDGFAGALAALGREHGAVLIGGDTCRGPLAVTVTASGFEAPGGAAP